MDELVETAAYITFPIVLLFGVFVALHGHLTPGGGFAGGAIIASGFALIIVCLGRKSEEMMMPERELSLMELLSGIVLISLIIIGFALRKYFLETQQIFKLWSGEYTIILNFVCCIMVMYALSFVLRRYVRCKE